MGRGNLVTGKIGERLASEYLRKRGYRILESSFRTFSGEIDLVAKKGDSIVFVEVKTRLTSSLGPPYLSVDWMKQRQLVKNAYSYLKMRRRADARWRIDVISVKLNGRYAAESIEHIENAVEERY